MNCKRPVLFTVREKNSIPLYDLLSDYRWVSDYLKCQEIQKQVPPLEEERQRLESCPLSKLSLQGRLKDSFKRIEAERIAWITKLLQEQRESPDPLTFFKRRTQMMGIKPLPPVLLWTEVEAALSKIPELDNAIADDDRERRLLKIERQLAGLKTDIASKSPEKFFLKQNGKVSHDARDLLVRGWWNLQIKTAEPCDPFGRTLEASPKAEKRAWEVLGISRVMNPYGEFLPGK